MRAHPARRLRRDRRGVIGIEVALLALPLSLILFGVFELGLTVKTRATLQYGSDLAARCAAVTPAICSNSAQVQAYIAPRLSGISLSANAFSLQTASCGKLVTATMTYQGATSHLLRHALVLTARSCYPI